MMTTLAGNINTVGLGFLAKGEAGKTNKPVKIKQVPVGTKQVPVVVKLAKVENGRKKVTLTQGNYTGVKELKEMLTGVMLTEGEVNKYKQADRHYKHSLMKALNTIHAYTYNTNTDYMNKVDNLQYLHDNMVVLENGIAVITTNNVALLINKVTGEVVKVKLNEGEYFIFVGGNKGLMVMLNDGSSEILIDNEWVTDYIDVLAKKTNRVVQPVVLQKGYTRVNFLGEYYRTHTLISLVEYGVTLTGLTSLHDGLLTVDHKNGKTDDNRISNLRLVTRVDNKRIANKKVKIYDLYNLVKGGK